MRTVLEFRTERYDYFAGGTQYKIHRYDDIVAGMAAYRHEQTFEFDYGDSNYRVMKPVLRQVQVDEVVPQRPHARSRREWENEQYLMARRKSRDDEYDLPTLEELHSVFPELF